MHWVLVDLNQCELNWIQIKGQEDIKPVALLCGPACLLPYYRMLLLVLKSDRLPFSFLSILSLYPNPSLCPFPESDSWIFVFGFAGIYHTSTWALWMLDWPLQLVSEPALCFFSSCSKYTIADAFLYEQSTRSRGNKEREAVCMPLSVVLNHHCAETPYGYFSFTLLSRLIHRLGLWVPLVMNWTRTLF